ncbi:hypothetical protein [Dechloromonas hortensis]|uniref:hypothetical protein n=1 Tax=Dechloromonas hortensis TaxID=337779 RepID=UPI0012909D00|nr:hypothetical protein [Dechloromonas hortensis]
MLETLGILFNSSDRSDQMRAIKRYSCQVDSGQNSFRKQLFYQQNNWKHRTGHASRQCPVPGNISDNAVVFGALPERILSVGEDLFSGFPFLLQAAVEKIGYKPSHKDNLKISAFA